jgi:hypothetical protein
MSLRAVLSASGRTDPAVSPENASTSLSGPRNTCRPECWCNLATHDKPDRAMRWTPDCEPVRFEAGEE